MGICSSCDATTVVAATATAKLVLQDGKLQEFARPVKAFHVLQKDPNCFVCSADDMEFDDFVSPVNADDELQPGQLYFLLPVSMLRRPLHAEEMAALAVKASAALMDSGGYHCRGGPVGRLVFPDASAGGIRSAVAPAARRRRGPSSKRQGGKGRDFKSELGGIPE
ncbi:hypothetical protein OPV22_033598 [Ensete ventricosum]|uniref:Uncharacterized protein n=1 Tax=Ensete ventricosum TaxID=4639 RepID=A0AAV8PYR1_ENSVE|nr:hypothetical protein OPV22_033598 [Ensete ventricosum]